MYLELHEVSKSQYIAANLWRACAEAFCGIAVILLEENTIKEYKGRVHNATKFKICLKVILCL